MSPSRPPVCTRLFRGRAWPRIFGVIVALASLSAGCSSPETEEEGEAAGSDLIGGREANALEVRATVHLSDGCTAAKIGPRHLLTAAHCVLELSILEPKYDAAHPVGLARDPASGHEPHAVANVHVHPAYLDECQKTLCSIASVAAKVDAPDIAVIELAEDLPGIDVVPIDTRPLRPNDAVVIVGFGCTEGVHLADTRSAASLRSADATIIDPRAAVHDGSPVAASDLPVFSGNYVLTDGPGASTGSAGLCPGDSGGPLYARRGTTGQEPGLVVVGVNANYTLSREGEDRAGLPITNWHTRIDGDSRHGVESWLNGLLEGSAAAEPRPRG